VVDVLTKKHRSWNMGRVRGKDTKPELLVRSVLHRNGYRFRLHAKGLPGKPDIVLAKHHTVVFVHGCFWHRHKRCPDATVPKSRTEFWIEKFTDNVKRDVRNQAALRTLGWTIIIVWECEIAKPDRLAERLRREIGASSNKLFTRDKARVSVLMT
jgi:DNA mismatch endonuclease (patch repair protein)